MKKILFTFTILLSFTLFAQDPLPSDTLVAYKKRVLETTEVDYLMSYYTQDGKNAAVSGGIGTEELQDITPTIVVSVPLNDDDVLTVDAGISAYTSASSSNINPFDSRDPDAFQASTGASSGDVWVNAVISYSHSSDDRNKIYSGKLSVANEFDYFSVGVGGSYTQLFNQKNTELSLSGNVYIDKWNAIYPYELRGFDNNGPGLNTRLFQVNQITGNTNYAPDFQSFSNENRNSYSFGASFSQILSKRLQGLIVADVVYQNGLLSTPFQRVYFADVADSYIGNFQLADNNEQLPDQRFKTAIGGRLNYYVNERIVLRTFYRYYTDDWGINSHTASLEVPVKISQKFTLYPSYRYYFQSAADYFAGYEQHLSTEKYYTSDYDLSEYNANQYGFGIEYSDILTSKKLWKLALKSINIKYNYYERNSGFKANLIAGGVKFIIDK
jgi:hypothetical protein